MTPDEPPTYTARERLLLWTLAVFGFIGVNGTFVFGLLRPEVMDEAMSNPVALAFMTEALVLMVVFAWLMTKWGVMRLRWPWFVVLSLVGSMAFALPVVLLWGGRKAPSPGVGDAREGASG